MSKVKYQKQREKIRKRNLAKINGLKTELCYIFEKGKGEFWVN